MSLLDMSSVHPTKNSVAALCKAGFTCSERFDVMLLLWLSSSKYNVIGAVDSDSGNAMTD